MPQPLDYSQASPRRLGEWLPRWVFASCAVLSLSLLMLTVSIWVRSYLVGYPSSDPTSGAAAGPPPRPHLIVPRPSDAAQYWVPLRGRLERWEYTGWDRKWYRLSRGTILPL